MQPIPRYHSHVPWFCSARVASRRYGQGCEIRSGRAQSQTLYGVLLPTSYLGNPPLLLSGCLRCHCHYVSSDFSPCGIHGLTMAGQSWSLKYGLIFLSPPSLWKSDPPNLVVSRGTAVPAALPLDPANSVPSALAISSDLDGVGHRPSGVARLCDRSSSLLAWDSEKRYPERVGHWNAKLC
ncbi:hypothetical protein ASPZODRAFT_280046 [Penicilliopsis zonata CBS 506.65]|uniref:Uncharacterized protein n=1 Tax=Penicilliopsis zonata CBS 506.65 TaxID=1073090 RepID=A0A1L9SUH7_9EURO|nr:hypothetical protein ASPZODRAFT_280046 [Penicilliopsis zonata CBS 506.65]OJJ50875.1 hypothetical protein ASPZODRAFT_280046 [Penicilliopsis zonata CBS 506.65]